MLIKLRLQRVLPDLEFIPFTDKNQFQTFIEESKKIDLVILDYDPHSIEEIVKTVKDKFSDLPVIFFSSASVLFSEAKKLGINVLDKSRVNDLVEIVLRISTEKQIEG